MAASPPAGGLIRFLAPRWEVAMSSDTTAEQYRSSGPARRIRLCIAVVRDDPGRVLHEPLARVRRRRRDTVSTRGSPARDSLDRRSSVPLRWHGVV